MKALLLSTLIMSASCSKTASPNPTTTPEQAGSTSAASREAGFEKLGPPEPGEWRYSFRESVQSFDDYVDSCANRKSAARSVFYIQPLGEAGERYRATIERMRAYAEAFFGVPAKVRETIPMFEEGWVPQRRQFNSTAVIAQLAGGVPEDALVYIGITEKDLFARGLNFVFGEGNLKNRCGLYSLTRYETDDEKLFLRRALKLMSHEVGHILSIHHCVTYRCVMQGANSLDEDDRHPMHLCPIDLRKLQWNTGFDVRARYRNLEKFYRETGLEGDAEWVSQRLK